MTIRTYTGVVVGLALCLCGSRANAQCTKDVECKGTRVCSNGACVDSETVAPARPPMVSPPAALSVPVTPGAFAPGPTAPEGLPASSPAAPVGYGHSSPISSSAQEQARSQWFSGYANVAGIVSFHSWLGNHGGCDYCSDSREEAGYGVYAAGYWVLAPLFHLGTFFHFYNAKAHGYYEDQGGSQANHIGSGMSLKIGGLASERIWIGGVVDLGVHIAMAHRTKVGVHIFPRLQADVLAARSGGLKLGLFGSIGPMLVPWTGPYVDQVNSIVALQMLMGLMVGG